MIIDSTIRTGDKDKDAYIEALEQQVQSFEANNSRKLLRSMDNMAGKISKDLDLIASDQTHEDGEEVTLSSKLVDTYLKMVEKADKIRNFIQIADSIMSGEVHTPSAVTTTTTVTQVVEEEKPANFFEETQKLAKERKNGKQ